MDIIELYIILIIIIIIIILIYFKNNNNNNIDNFTLESIIGIQGERGDIGEPGKDATTHLSKKNPNKRKKVPLFKFIKQKKYKNEDEVILGQYPPKESYPSVEEIAENNLEEVIIEIPSGKKGIPGNSVIGNTGIDGEDGDVIQCHVVGDRGPAGSEGPPGPPGLDGNTILNIDTNNIDTIEITYTNGEINTINKNLKGVKGEPGLDGIDGSDGKKGANGEIWKPIYDNEYGTITFNNPNGIEVYTTNDLRCKCTNTYVPESLLEKCPPKPKLETLESDIQREETSELDIQRE